MDPYSVALLFLFGAGVLVAVINLIRPALGVRVWTAGGHVPLHHALSDPEVVRRRMMWRTTVLALPGLLGGPALLLLGLFNLGSVFEGLKSALFFGGVLLAGAAICFVACVIVLATGQVYRRRTLSVREGAAHWGLAALSICGTAVWLVVLAAGGSPDVMGAIVLAASAVWLVSAALLANEVRIVATWDRLCASRRPHVEEPSNAKSH